MSKRCFNKVLVKGCAVIIRFFFLFSPLNISVCLPLEFSWLLYHRSRKVENDLTWFILGFFFFFTSQNPAVWTWPCRLFKSLIQFTFESSLCLLSCAVSIWQAKVHKWQTAIPGTTNNLIGLPCEMRARYEVHLRRPSEVSIFRFCLACYAIESLPETCEQLPCFCSSPRASHWISGDFLSWRSSPVRVSPCASPLRLLSLAVSCEPSRGSRRSPATKLPLVTRSRAKTQRSKAKNITGM